MSRLWSRRRSTSSDASSDRDPVRSVRLDDADYAWWAQEEVKQVWRPRPPRIEPEPKRDILAEHFGDDWRTSFGFTPTTTEAPPSPSAADTKEPEERDPYEVLEVEPTATWEEIIAAHRHQARTNHPDLLFGQSEEEKAASEARIRIINAAYKELRIRRGM